MIQSVFGYSSVEMETVSRRLKFCNRETSLGPNRAGVSIAVLKKLLACGRIFRLLDCIHWAAQAPALSFLKVYEPRMAQARQALRQPGQNPHAHMTNRLEDLLKDSGQPGLVELRELLDVLLARDGGTCRLLEHHQLSAPHARVFRLRFGVNGNGVRSLVVKRLEPVIAQRNELVATRWLPAIGLGESGPRLLGVAAERCGQCVWHVYQDLGDWALAANDPEPKRVAAAVALIAQIHTRFAEHPLLAECRLGGADLGIHFFASNVRDAIRGLHSIQPPQLELSPRQLQLRDRLLARLHKLKNELASRALALDELGGPETLLHGDLWTTNTFVVPAGSGLQARLIDWDHAGVGPASYDLSTFLLRFPPGHRGWILELYRDAVARAGWRLPPARDLNLLFETAEYGRYANRIIWPAIALLKDRAEWAFDELAEIDQWFEVLQPVLTDEKEIRDGMPVTP